MAKAATKTKPAIEAAPTLRPTLRAAVPRGTKVIYRPLNVTDPNVMKWNGVTFHANVPVMLDPAQHFVVVPFPQFIVVDGQTRSVHRDTKVSMIDLAKDNPSFEVEGFPRARVHVNKRVVPPPGTVWDEANDREMVEAREWDTGKWTNESETEALI
jgi:hypothetical protein